MKEKPVTDDFPHSDIKRNIFLHLHVIITHLHLHVIITHLHLHVIITHLHLHVIITREIIFFSYSGFYNFVKLTRLNHL